MHNLRNACPSRFCEMIASSKERPQRCSFCSDPAHSVEACMASRPAATFSAEVDRFRCDEYAAAPLLLSPLHAEAGLVLRTAPCFVLALAITTNRTEYTVRPAIVREGVGYTGPQSFAVVACCPAWPRAACGEDSTFLTGFSTSVAEVNSFRTRRIFQ
jgi:hypothetical protein